MDDSLRSNQRGRRVFPVAGELIKDGLMAGFWEVRKSPLLDGGGVAWRGSLTRSAVPRIPWPDEALAEGSLTARLRARIVVT